eukprot:CAMPEP_0182446554 /NCGR_PEP_ID=MMETSP1172-20130603/4280_1 /TAXON_ID=708627 /ORGANISM="Timspurckia oligopyrenoides, Strain CCMP3278" /LENGTH=347 /DNA_ID=CAMNT_0024642505 /DNA_START=92 /DNA_END=1135 /DNA_ORIENTATION=-
MGQTLSTTNFFLFGKSHCTASGYHKHVASYYKTPDILDSIDLASRTYVVTGANSGIGKEICSFLARKQGKVYMICRNLQRANAARDEIISQDGVKADNVVTIIGDCGLKQDVIRMSNEISSREPGGIDALVCNAGALLNERTLTSEGVETTIATHLIYGSYLLSQRLEESLRIAAKNGREPRVVMVSSGGMYNTAFPDWSIAASIQSPNSKSPPKYDGQLAYAYAKRGQVLLCERMSKLEINSPSSSERIIYCSCHPGWTATPGVSSAYGEQSKYLEPLRTLWQGSEGICWLCVVPRDDIEPGAFYLDRKPQRKHLGGPFFTEGSFTKNSEAEVDKMMEELAKAQIE